MHFPAVIVLCLFTRIANGEVDDDEVFQCKPHKNFENKVQKIVSEKMQYTLDPVADDVRKIQSYMEKADARSDQKNKEMLNIEARLRAVEDKLGVKIKLEECPKSGTSGIYTIYGIAYPEGLSVYCDTQTDGGGWVVIQRRFNGKLSFDREWDQYVKGFGTLSGEFWLGLDDVVTLLSSGEFEFRVDISDWEGNSAYALYSKFSMGGTSSNYQLTVSGYSGTAGDSLSHHSGMAFSTKDRDNDTDDDGNCAKDLKGGWWFTGCNLSHLNGVYYKGGHYPVGLHTVQDGASWYYWKDTKLYSMKTTEMKIRLKN
ncbi:fibrinogen C domain-containing protein 1-like [Styela clava]|uniref:fibrinogen C domain-containing protein 1-like n=1 Tax=Styela clava TaxID=7725 RepID=UPI00193A0F97|nr:fibrinogen C domain-containing protein 1-like [Styela clava]